MLLEALDDVDQLPVHSDVSAIVHLVREAQNAALRRHLVVDVAVVGVERLEAHRLLRLHAATCHRRERLKQRHRFLHRHRAEGLRRTILHRPVRDLEVLGDDVAENLPLLRHVSGLAQRRVVVVAGGIRLEVVAVAVGAGEEVVVGSAEVHVEADGGVHRQHLVERVGECVRVHFVVLVAPVVQPARVKLRVHLGTHLRESHLGVEGTRGVSNTEIDGRVDFGSQRAALQRVIVRRVRREVDDVLSEVLLVELEQPAQIVLVTGRVESVFVLDLHSDDVTTVAVDVGTNQGEQDVEVVLNMLQINRIHGTDLDSGFADEPVGETTEIPLTADIRTRAQNDVHVVLLSNLEELNHIGNSIEIELSLAGLVKVPSDVGLNGIQSSIGHLLDRVFPVDVVLARFLTEVVEGSCNIVEGLSIELKVVADNSEGSLRQRGSNKKQTHEEFHLQTKKI